MDNHEKQLGVLCAAPWVNAKDAALAVIKDQSLITSQFLIVGNVRMARMQHTNSTLYLLINAS
jgi:hypothetical protein